MPVERLLPNPEAEGTAFIDREIADKELAPIAAEYEMGERYPGHVFRILGETGLLGLPYPEQYGGGGQTYESTCKYLRSSLRDGLPSPLRSAFMDWLVFPLAEYGTAEQKSRWLPDMLRGQSGRSVQPQRVSGRIRSCRTAMHRDARPNRLSNTRRKGLDYSRWDRRCIRAVCPNQQ